MAERSTLSADARDVKEKKARQLRREGWIPAVIYGQDDNLTIQIENLPLRRVLREVGTTNLIDIEVSGSKHTVLAKDVQLHATRGDLIHVDFYEVNMSETIVVEAALVPVGTSKPVSDGLGTVAVLLHSVEIECLPDNLISEIEFEQGLIATPDDMIHVSDLKIPEGVTILTPADSPVARFEYLQAEIEEKEEEEEELLFAPAADEVEVISRGKAEDGEEIED